MLTSSPPTLVLTALTAGTSTNAEGSKLFAALAPYVAQAAVVRLSLLDASPMSTSFLNSSFGELIDDFGLAAVRSSVKLVDYLPSHAARIKQYIDDFKPVALC
ncbi:hypothetical protein A0257_18465 [Hymenobacter psoromatis]|nr:hypothetical protein A0257_18465 [Hymenobacter psoromatis]